jgi:hypothetical protein
LTTPTAGAAVPATVVVTVDAVVLTVPTTVAAAAVAVSTTVGVVLGGTGPLPPSGGALPVNVEPPGEVGRTLASVCGAAEPCSPDAGTVAVPFGLAVVDPLTFPPAAPPPALCGPRTVEDPPGSGALPRLPPSSPGGRTMLPRAPRSCPSLGSSTAELAKGTSFAAIRATVAGSGRERPRAAQSGIGSASARAVRARACQPRKEVRSDGRTRFAIAAVMTKRAVQALSHAA